MEQIDRIRKSKIEDRKWESEIEHNFSLSSVLSLKGEEGTGCIFDFLRGGEMVVGNFGCGVEDGMGIS